MNKLQMVKNIILTEVRRVGVCSIDDEKLQEAWNIADKIQAEADKREKQKQDKLKQDQQNHHDELVSIGLEEWQPDWSQLPSVARYWAMDGCGMCNVYENEPEICGSQWDFGGAICECDSFGYKGDWRNSLRKRP